MSRQIPLHLITTALAAMVVISLLAAGCTDVSGKTSGVTPVPTISGVQSQQAAAAQEQKQSIAISGSTTVLPIVQKAADQYMATHPGADIQVAGGGSGAGVQAIGAGTVDIGMSSREVTQAEQAKYPDLVITPVAQDAIAVVVNPSNTLPYITPDQVRDIYLGKITTWSGISGATVPGTSNRIVVIGRDSASGTRTYFDEAVLLKATPTSMMLEKNSNGAVAQTVAQTPGAIGYLSLGYITPEVRALPLSYSADRIITPGISTVKDKTYPLSRSLYVITKGQPSGLTKEFIDYLVSADGQKIVADEGYITLT